MESKLFFVFGFALLAGLAIAKQEKFNNFNEYEESLQNDVETPKKEETANDKESKMVMEDMDSKTSIADAKKNADAIKHKGYCHFGIAAWFKPGVSVRCNCLRCTCQSGGSWACAYHFAFCPYYYCGNEIFNPDKQICCCGKVYEKKAYFACCGHFFYDTRSLKCCMYYSVKPKNATCPRFKI